MIQRVQSVYLFVGAVLLAIYAFMPAVIDASGAPLLSASMCPLDALSGSLLTLLALIVVLALVAIFKFKNLRLQHRLCKISVLLTLALLVSVGISAYYMAGRPAWHNMLPVAALICFALASKGVAHDRKLLSDSSRLR